MLKSKVTKLIKDASGSIIGVEGVTNDGKAFTEHGPVIICTGGYGADFSEDSLLIKHRPDLAHLPTTNGDHCTGDGLKMAVSVGADTVDLEWIQVHPTGLVHPDEPDAKERFPGMTITYRLMEVLRSAWLHVAVFSIFSIHFFIMQQVIIVWPRRRAPSHIF